MTRKYSHGLEEPEYNRNHRSLPLGLSRSVRESARVYPIGSHAASLNLTREPEVQSEKQRRRIAVACSRCRKRKIKCSGDIGNGQGCQNCRNAGTDPQQCQFLRVNSSNFECSPAEWPYMLGGVSPMVSAGSSLAIFNTNNSNNAQTLSSLSFPGVSRQPRHPFATPYPYPPVHNGPDYYGYGMMSSNEGMFETPYSISTGPQNYLSSQEASTSNHFGSAEHLRHWNLSMHPGRHGPANFDTDVVATRYSASSNHYPGTLNSLPRTEAGPLFPGMGSLASSLPASSLLENRLLPSPRIGSLPSVSESISAASHVHNGDLANSQASKVIIPWAPERVIKGGGQASTSTAPASTPGTLLSSSSRKSSPASPQELQESTFGYIAVPTTQNSPAINSTPEAEFPISTVGTTSNNVDDHILYHSQPSIEGREPLRSHVTSSGSYSYITGAGSKHGPASSGPEPTLLSGQTYHPINHLRQQASQQQPIRLSETMRRDSGEMAARNTQRSSSASLGKPLR